VNGLSVVICCHNGAMRLTATLAHLKLQDPPTAPWEVLIVDNASTDGTAEFAQSCWQAGPAPMRVVNEPRLGVRYARARGFSEAKYDFIGFVDDDNWVARDWARTAYAIISSDIDLGAVGSVRASACEVPPPKWFDDFHESYAILTEGELRRIEAHLEYLPTAGLCVRKCAWEMLIRKGFEFQLTGTVGQNLGEDVELTRALRLSGWRLAIDRRLQLRHFMPAYRLNWNYLRRLSRGQGASATLLDAYSDHSISLEPGLRRWLSERWWYQFALRLAHLACRPRVTYTALAAKGEGRLDVVEVERQCGRMLELLRLRGRYGDARRKVRQAPWRHLSPI
jgi:cellulose synthase/poly-beta-1,6-N-acetylglucosamine synthase-like glycosyltransferase